MIAVLLLDDDHGLSELCRAFLESCGDIRVQTAATVKEALDAIASASYDAIISDYHLPDGDGLDLLRRLRETEKRVPFIMFTGTRREDVVAEAYALGADLSLQKGYDLEAQCAEIGHLLRNMVKGREVEEELFMARLQVRLVSASNVTCWYLDDATGLFRFDGSFSDFFGSEASGEDGRSLSKEEYVRRFVHPDDATMVREWIGSGGARLLRPGEFLQTEHRFVRGDGEVRYLLVRVAYFSGGDGRKARVYGLNQDITDLVRSLEQVKKAGAAPRPGDGGPRIGLCFLDGGPERPQSFRVSGMEV